MVIISNRKDRKQNYSALFLLTFFFIKNDTHIIRCRKILLEEMKPLCFERNYITRFNYSRVWKQLADINHLHKITISHLSEIMKDETVQKSGDGKLQLKQWKKRGERNVSQELRISLSNIKLWLNYTGVIWQMSLQFF